MSLGIPSGRAALQQQRAVLAELFRFGERSISDFTDARVCRLYLCGLCPSELFPNTKFALPACTKVHDDTLRQQYESALGKGGPNYEGLLLEQLEGVCERMERRALMDARRGEEEDCPGSFIPRVETEHTPEIEAAEKEIADKERSHEAAVACGSILGAQALEDELAALRRKKCLLQARACREASVAPPAGRVAHPRLRMCSGCGVQVNLVDADDRTADHFGGRAHLGHVLAAQTVKRLREKRGAQGGGAAPPSGRPF